VAYSEKASRKDRYYIEGLQAQGARNIRQAMLIYQRLIDDYPLEKQAYYAMASLKFNLGKYDEAISHLHNAIALDPLFGNAYNLLSFSYSRLGNLDKALKMNDRSIFLDPNEPNPYDSRGEILAKFKLYDRAIESFKKAIDKKSDFYSSWRNLGNVYTYVGDFIRAESCFQVIASVEDIYVWTDGKVYLAQNLIYQGKFQEALAVLTDGSREDKKAHGEELYATYYHLAALIYEQLGEFTSALEEIARAQEIARRAYPDEKIYWRRYYVRIWAAAGDTASARRLSEELKTSLEKASRKLGDYWYSLGAVEMAEGHLDNAEAYFRKATIEADTFDYSAHYMLGRVLLDLGRPEKAVEQFNVLLADQKAHPENWGSLEAEVYYYLGLAYQKSGKPHEALEHFTKYVDIRANADSRIKSVIDARERSAALITELSS
jgi:tetratricopeptide (TPR) repeat protein